MTTRIKTTVAPTLAAQHLLATADLLTVSEVAQIFRVDDTTVRRWIKQGALEAIQLPHINARQAYRIQRQTVERRLGLTA